MEKERKGCNAWGVYFAIAGLVGEVVVILIANERLTRTEFILAFIVAVALGVIVVGMVAVAVVARIMRGRPQVMTVDRSEKRQDAWPTPQMGGYLPPPQWGGGGWPAQPYPVGMAASPGWPMVGRGGTLPEMPQDPTINVVVVGGDE